MQIIHWQIFFKIIYAIVIITLHVAQRAEIVRHDSDAAKHEIAARW